MTLTKYASNIKMGDIDECGCARPYNEAVAVYNRLLREQLRRLQSMLPTSDIVFVDTFHIQYSMIKHAHRYGMYTSLMASNSYTKQKKMCVVTHSLFNCVIGFSLIWFPKSSIKLKTKGH